MRLPRERAERHAGGLASSLATLLLASLLTGCAAWAPASQVEAWPVSAPCIAKRPAAPVLPAVPAHGIFEQVQALLAREQLRAAHVRQLEILLDACTGG
ncbi:hypothetical protein VM94_03008 [Janthinobacterium sp. KBS0711]|nr:hypothetical protein VM94_03008 [Janthinobacterium sp. KBS0711]